MTPDRNDHTPDDDTENGVLAEAGGIDTTAIGILGGGTEQVSVSIPSASDDEELDDDDVVGDEVVVESVEFAARIERPAYEAEWLGEAALEAASIPDAGSAAEGESGADDATAEEDAADEGTAAAPDAEEIEAEIDADEPEQPEALADDDFDGPVLVEGVDADDIDGTADIAVIEESDDDPSDDDPSDADEHSAALGHEAAADADTSAPGGAPESTVEAEIVTDQENPAPDAAAEPAPLEADAPTAAAASVSGSVPTTTGSNPATRREAHAETVEKQERAHAMERVQPRADVTLTSKRLDEFEPGRESADLLTADRLLDPHQVVRPEPEGAWQHFVYSITGRRVNLGDGKRARARKELDRRIASPLGQGARFVPVLSRKGGVGKTTITTLLGMALADARDDRVIAIDANPDRGTLADRIARQNGKTVRDLARARGEISGYAGISSIVARDDTRLDILASDADPRVSEAFNDRDYHDVASIAAHYYSIVLTDTGTGIVHSVMQATLDLADQLVVVSGLSVDEARLASETLTWLETNGYAEQVRGAVVVLNNARPGTPLVRLEELETHFKTRVRAVVRVPYDPHIAAGSAITFRDLRPETRLAARELAAGVVEGLRGLASAA
ncbi:MinD/ParA family ATP-binding protein [Microbacterium sp. F51-2R]|uniref:MinD/ParA family ATP-binding protein n=1 Tax=Microbacterium sp. F51-2R TaxID=3445777 RepID=UPI003FA16DD9